MFSSFDSKVILAEYAKHLIPREDPEAGQLLQALFERDGIKVLTDTEVTKVEQRGGKKVVHFRRGGRPGMARVDEILLAAGMRPNLDMGLENAGVDYTSRGITTDNTMVTSNSNIYAAGDVAGPYAFTHTASYQSRVAVHNMYEKHKVVAKYHAVPRVVYTDPEVASVGMTEAHLRHRKIKYLTNAVSIDIIGRANTSNRMDGFVKVITSRTGTLLGATIVAPHAGEMIHELALAVNLGLKADDIASTIHAFPTWSEAVRIACAGI
jgi:pyruvate/2-oxoglutarate dehydrogenase complex dihydrolipoamide dehydrogenase (E3) component